MSAEATVHLLSRWQAGDQAAADELFHRYARRLVALAQTRLSARLAARVSPEDIVQSAYCSFFTRARDGHYALEHAGDLWRLLVTITLNKVRHHRDRHRAGKRDAGREAHAGEGDLSARVHAREPAPEEAVAVLDTLESVLDGMEDWQRRAVEMRLQGYSLVEIAAATGWAFSTVRRLLERVRARLEDRSGTGAG